MSWQLSFFSNQEDQCNPDKERFLSERKVTFIVNWDLQIHFSRDSWLNYILFSWIDFTSWWSLIFDYISRSVRFVFIKWTNAYRRRIRWHRNVQHVRPKNIITSVTINGREIRILATETFDWVYFRVLLSVWWICSQMPMQIVNIWINKPHLFEMNLI